jgi:hypothetical protein
MDSEKCDCGSDVAVINNIYICSACGRSGNIQILCKACNKMVTVEILNKKLFGVDCAHLDGVEVEVDYEEVFDDGLSGERYDEIRGND